MGGSSGTPRGPPRGEPGSAGSVGLIKKQRRGHERCSHPLDVRIGIFRCTQAAMQTTQTSELQLARQVQVQREHRLAVERARRPEERQGRQLEESRGRQLVLGFPQES